MLPRTLEPEVMDTAQEAADYDAMDHSEVNRRFVDDWGTAGLATGRLLVGVHSPMGGSLPCLPPLPHNRPCFRIGLHCGGEGRGEGVRVRDTAPSPQPSPPQHTHSEGHVDRGGEGAGRIPPRGECTPPAAALRMLDVGTGTALIPIEFCRSFPNLRIVAIDLANEMLKLATANVERAGFRDRIELRLVDAKRIPCPDGEFATVVSNSIIHHIPRPLDSLAEMVRVLAPGGLLFVRDLLRPRTEAELEALVTTYTPGATPSMRQLFRQSLHAALTVEEVADMLDQLGLNRAGVRATSDRHWTFSGVLPAR